MIDPEHFERVRIVQDKSIDAELNAYIGKDGTTVLEDIFAASADSLFPLQGALGYELHQTLFVGPYTVVVEGAADLLFLQAMSAILQEETRTGLDWTGSSLDDYAGWWLGEGADLCCPARFSERHDNRHPDRQPDRRSEKNRRAVSREAAEKGQRDDLRGFYEVS